MQTISRFFTITFLIGALGFGLAACQTTNPFEPQVNLIARNHNAADALISQAGKSVSKNTPLIVSTISNVNAIDTSSPLGRAMSEQILSRFVERGFSNVSEIRLRSSLFLRENGSAQSGEFLLSRDARAITEVREAGLVVTGTYTVAKGQVLTTVRLNDIVTGQVIASHDYALPLNSNIKSMLESEERLGTAGGMFAYDQPF